MFFAIPIVGKILAGMAAAEASADVSAAQKTTQLKVASQQRRRSRPSRLCADAQFTMDQAAARTLAQPGQRREGVKRATSSCS